MLARPPKTPTEPSAFIAWENRRKARYELIAGEVRMMAGGSRAHDRIATRLIALLERAAGRRGCDVHGSNLKVVSPVGMVTYPDVFVRCGSLADDATECDDPVVVIEVLSPTTRNEDLVRKRWGYQAIPTLVHLVYVDAGRRKVEVATRAPDGSWRSVFLADPEDAIALEGIGAELPLREVYAGTGMA